MPVMCFGQMSDHCNLYYPKYDHHNIYTFYSDTRIRYLRNDEIKDIAMYTGLQDFSFTSKNIVEDKTAISDLDTRSSGLDANTQWDNDRPYIFTECNTYGFSEEFRNDFIIFEYKFKNCGVDTIKSLFLHRKFEVYISSAEDFMRPWKDDRANTYEGFDNEFFEDEKIYMVYAFDGDNPDYPGDDTGGINGECPGYLGFCSIFSSPTKLNRFPENTPAYMMWGENYMDHRDYKNIIWRMENDSSTYMTYEQCPFTAYTVFIGWGPYDLVPGDSVKIVFAYGLGEGLDNMFENFKWARRTYRSGFKSPVPVSPQFEFIKKENGVQLSWNINDTDYINPFTNRSGFSGYKIYKTEFSSNYLKLIDYIDLLKTISKDEIDSDRIEFLDTNVENGKKYVYTVVNYLEDTDGKYYESSKRRWVTIVEYDVPDEYILYQNYPNPFNSGTKINFELKKETEITLKIYNLLGQEVKTILNNRFHFAGPNSVSWDGTNDSGVPVSSGVYIYKFKAGDFVQSKKMILMK